MSASNRIALSLVQFGALIHVVGEYCVDVSMTKGPSMLPTFNHSGDVVLVDKCTYHLGPHMISKGDVVVARSPVNPNQTVCKRVAAVPGDEIRIQDGWGRRVKRLVPPGHVWLLGDNASNSTDSRKYGPVPIGLIRGRVMCRFWPLQEMRWIGTNPR
jgi:inner membrane protease subunit 1